MESPPDFLLAFLKRRSSWPSTLRVKEPLFSRGTYQVEVTQKGKRTEYPFLQMTQEGEITDFFCTCTEGEPHAGCLHLAAAYAFLVQEGVPFHVAFQESFFQHLWQWIASVSRQVLPIEGGAQEEGVFRLVGKTGEAKKRIASLFFEKKEETEETSIKFSNLSLEELSLYRAGKAKDSLLYELSFWSDVAKWLFFLAKTTPYAVRWGQGAPPEEVEISFEEADLFVVLPLAAWKTIVGSVATLHSSLQVLSLGKEGWESVFYDEEREALRVVSKTLQGHVPLQEHPLSVGDWYYVPNLGFVEKRALAQASSFWVEKEEMGEFLTSHMHELSSFLSLREENHIAQYALHISQEGTMQIAMYLFSVGDLQQKGAAFFAPWAYLPGKGFFFVQDSVFAESFLEIPRENVGDFISQHRVFLHRYPPFATHLGSLESQLHYRFLQDGSLLFEADALSSTEEVLHFQEWIYVRGKGFYKKQDTLGRLPLYPGLVVSKQELGDFLATHVQELEQVRGFFAKEPLIVQATISIDITEEKRIFITPVWVYREGIENVEFFGNFVFASGIGFTEVPLMRKIPLRYRTPHTIPLAQEASFVHFELPTLLPFASFVHPSLQVPTRLVLEVTEIIPDKKGGGWGRFRYRSLLGHTPLFEVAQAIALKKKHHFSPSGLLFVQEMRFRWISLVKAKQWDKKKEMVRLASWEWLRLFALEEVVPAGKDAASLRKHLDKMQTLSQDEPFDISYLRSHLRPYQKEGVQWLWFLYRYGMSGILADDMGLGKTHQAMALLAAIFHENRQAKFLVVCPTSVLYHWEALLQKFLPDIKVKVYYGAFRSLKDFPENGDLLLTSYGTLRSSYGEIRAFSFTLAIFDEMQVAKNSMSRTHKVLKMLQSDMRLGLTGTPMENKVVEVKALFDILLPSYFPSDALFKELFLHPIEKEGDLEKKELLRTLLRPFLLRRKKQDVLSDLPEKIEEVLYADLSKEQEKLYVQVASKIRQEWVGKLQDPTIPVSYVHIFSALSTLKRICDHPALNSKELEKAHLVQDGKFALFTELLEEARESGQKVVVFSQYLDMLTILENYLHHKGIGFATIRGSTKDRKEEIERFHRDPRCEVFLASLLAAGVGIDLTAASVVIHYDRWWNPAKEDQATDRVHRIGQNRGVQVLKLVTKNTIEEHIHALIDKKRGLVESLLSQEDEITYLTRDELIDVLKRI